MTDEELRNLADKIVRRLDWDSELIKGIANHVKTYANITTKEVLTSEECAYYMGVSRSYLYKMTMRKEIPHYKPSGKMCYFNRKEIEAYMQNNRIPSVEEQAKLYCKQNPLNV